MLATELVRSLNRLLPSCKFLVLTSQRNHNELSFLDSVNVHRQCVANAGPRQSFFSDPEKIYLRTRLRAWLSGVLPPSLLARLKGYYPSGTRRKRSTTELIQKLKADLLFCPFTVPSFYSPTVPIISVIYDLQHLTYPQFLEGEDYSFRERNFKEACRLTDRLICISDYLRRTVLENSDLSPERVVSIPFRLSERMKKPSSETISGVLEKYGLKENNFLLYPANFWPHKNHFMLFTAFGMYRSLHPQSTVRLVCAGTADEKMEALKEAARRMGLGNFLSFPGYLPDEEFAALLASCQTVIFPSLYEGFGMPVLEAMTFAKPVLCSNITSLPEMAGDAALYFDPRKPEEILAAIEQITRDAHLRDQLIKRAANRSTLFRNTEDMAYQYLKVFEEAVNRWRSCPVQLHGVYPDGWTQERVEITYPGSSVLRRLQMTFEVPSFYPYDRSVVKISENGNRPKVYRIRRGKSGTISYPLSMNGGSIELVFKRTFRPKELGMNDDERRLGCVCRECLIQSGPDCENLLGKTGP